MSLERIEDVHDTPWWGEHMHRYVEAATFVRAGSRVLDLACGTGFGAAAMVKAGAAEVLGGDISPEAVEACKEKYNREVSSGALDFRILDVTRLNLPDDYFDLVLSFETLEHVADYGGAIQEYGRVLKKGGTFLLSTPNIRVSSPDGNIVNPYHIKEFTREELEVLLNKVFSHCRVGAQRYRRYDQGGSLAQGMERLLYQRGMRSLPLSVRNGLMRMAGGKKLYPGVEDYVMTFDPSEADEAYTLYAVCQK